jgi:eukaryotic-like serine/threonine-protein kinase
MPEHTNARWLQIEGLYHRALEHDATARDAFLDETCLGDDALRREVQSLLGFERAADRFLERPALAEAARHLAHDPRPVFAGRRLGGYEISTLLGTGGMGEVYRARVTCGSAVKSRSSSSSPRSPLIPPTSGVLKRKPVLLPF